MLATRSRRIAVIVLFFAAINIAGIVWIHHDLVRSGRPHVRVLGITPDGPADDAQRISLLFDEPLADASMLGKPLDRSPFVVSPAPSGHWQWTTADRLELVLSKPLPPGRTFTVKPSADMEQLTGRQIIGDSEFQLATRRLAITRCDLRSAGGGSVTFELRFNQPVHPQDAAKAVKVAVNNAPDVASTKLTPTCMTKQPSDRLVFRVHQGAEKRVDVIVDASLKGVGADLDLGVQQVRSMFVQPRFCFLRSEVQSVGLEKNISVELQFSNDLDSKHALAPVVVTPEVKGMQSSVNGQSIVLTGPFQPGRRYRAVVSGAAMAASGEALGRNQTAEVEIPSREPSLSMAVRNGILSPKGRLSLDVRATNINKIEASATAVYANNLVSHLNNADDDYTSRTLPGKTYNMDIPRDEIREMTLDLRDLAGKHPRGIYSVQLSYSDSYWQYVRATVCVTDLAMTAKRTRDGYLVWVTSLAGGTPQAGAKVAAYTKNNQQLVSAYTDAAGLAMLPLNHEHPEGPVFVLTAELGDDLSYLQPRERPWVIEEVDQGGADLVETYDVMLYCERGVYLPGETVHLAGIIRDGLGNVPPPFPLVIEVIRPDGHKAADIMVRPDSSGQGVFHCDYPTTSDGWTGRYVFNAKLPGAKEVLGSADARVEPFSPARIEAKASAVLPTVGPGQEPQVDVAARYLLGQSAGGLGVALNGEYRQVPYESQAYKGYIFGDSSQQKRVRADEQAGVLDDKGKTRLTLKLPEWPDKANAADCLWAGSFVATVTEPGSRSVSAGVSFKVDPVGRHLGLRMPPGRLLTTNSPCMIDWVLVDSADKPAAAGAVEVKLDRVEWDWALERVNGRSVWKSVKRLIAVKSFKLDGAAVAPSAGRFEIVAPQGGMYRLRATDIKSGTFTLAEFYASERSDDTAANLVNRPERLEIVLDQKRYTPGSVARVLVRSPFAGTMLLTLESDHVLVQRVVKMDSKSCPVDLPVPADLRGGAFVAATVVRPVDSDEGKWLPHRAIGMARLELDHSASVMPLMLGAPKKVTPGSTVSFGVSTDIPRNIARPGMVHVWAVDEGILMTTGYDTPDLADHFLAMRELGVDSSDVFGDLLPDYKRALDITRIGAGDGGPDADGRRSMRLNPTALKHRASAVVWQTFVPVGPDGIAQVRMDLPKHTGELRLMAVAVDHDRYGTISQPLTLASPIMVEASWPRFAAPGDRFDVPVKVFNTSDQEQRLSITANYRGNIAIEHSDPKGKPIAQSDRFHQNLDTLVIPAGQSATYWLHVTAGEVGDVDVAIHADTGGSKNLGGSDSWQFTIRQAAPLHSVVRSLQSPAGKELTIPLPDVFLPGSAFTTVTVSGRPIVDLRPAVERLIGYPYGCVEQTSSKLLGMLYAPDLLGPELAARTPASMPATSSASQPTAAVDARTEALRAMVQAGIDRLWSMQTNDGGLAYWPGYDDTCLWGTAYAAGCLAQAKRAGYSVDQRFVDELARYLLATLNDTRQNDDNAHMNANTRAMLCHVLASFGRPQMGWMNSLSERLDKLDMGGRAHLAGAYLEAGRKDLAVKCLPKEASLLAGKATGESLGSATGQQAALLNVLLDLDANHPLIPALVGQLQKARATNGYWGSTVENAACIAALCRYQMLTMKDQPDFTGKVLLGDGTVRQFAHAEILTARFRGDKPATITSSGSGTLYVTVQSEGLGRKERFKPYDRGIEVRRVWKDRQGQPLNGRKLKVGELVRVELTCRTVGGGKVDNVAIVDALPAGMEVENPGLLTSEYIFTSATDTHLEILDDRLLLFTNVSPTARTYTYHMRATAAGSFDLPPVQGSCMYDASFASVHGGGRVEIGK